MHRKILVRGAFDLIMLRVIVCMIEGLLAGVIVNWILFNILIEFEALESDWILLVKVLIAVVFTLAGILLTFPFSAGNEGSEGGF